MENSYILIHQDNSSMHLALKYNIRKVFDEIFFSTTTDKIYLDENEFVTYSLSTKDKNLIYLKIESDLSDMKAAHLLDSFSNKFERCEQRKDYKIIKTYSQSSNLYCCKLMKPFGEFERRLRELIYLTVIKAFGIEWLKESFDASLESAVKERLGSKKSKILELALEELTYEQLLEYLFTPRSKFDFERYLEKFTDEDFQAMSHEELVQKISSARKVSLWDELFFKYQDLKDLNVIIRELQPLRNRVMHHKNISEQEFKEAKKKLKIVNAKLEKAIVEIEGVNFSEFDISIVVNAVQSVKTMLSELAVATYSGFQELIKGVTESLSGMKKLYQDSFVNPLADTMSKINFADIPKIETASSILDSYKTFDFKGVSSVVGSVGCIEPIKISQISSAMNIVNSSKPIVLPELKYTIPKITPLPRISPISLQKNKLVDCEADGIDIQTTAEE